MIPQHIKERIEKDAEETFPLLHFTANSEKNANRNRRAYELGAEAEAERAEQLYDCLLNIRNNIYTAGAINKKIDETLATYNSKKR